MQAQINDKEIVAPPVDPKILVMEDEASMAEGLKMILSEDGYKVDVAGDGQSALDYFKRNTFDLLLADLRLPDMDGLDVIRQLKQDLPLADVVVITGYPSVDTAVSSASLGVRDYLRKPFTEDEIKTVVHDVFRTRNQGSREKFLNETKEGRLIQKREVIKVLDRTAMDWSFWKDLSDDPSKVLENYQLSSAAKAAIACGDLRWINQYVGELTQKQLMFMYKRLEREVW